MLHIILSHIVLRVYTRIDNNLLMFLPIFH
nr:MAG TPA: hypothetical protein [Caudoviricetes sp.]